MEFFGREQPLCSLATATPIPPTRRTGERSAGMEPQPLEGFLEGSVSFWLLLMASRLPLDIVFAVLCSGQWEF